MTGNRVIHVSLPDVAELSREDVTMLQGVFDAIVSLRYSQPGAGDEIESELAAEGWSVQSRLKWVAEARRGAEYEQVTGESKADALRHLRQLVRADQVISAP